MEGKLNPREHLTIICAWHYTVPDLIMALTTEANIVCLL
jgi:hypothetical protein